MQHIRISKFLHERIPITINMLGRCGDAEYPVNASVVCIVSSGIDPDASNVLDGTATVIDQQSVQQYVVDGVSGVVYQLQFAIDTNLGSTYIDTVHLAILPDGS